MNTISETPADPAGRGSESSSRSTSAEPPSPSESHSESSAEPPEPRSDGTGKKSLLNADTVTQLLGDSVNADRSHDGSASSSEAEHRGFFSKVRHTVFGKPRNLQDPHVFHSISLIAFLAWVGLGADGLSSSAYGPDESFRALGTHHYLAVGLALATAITVFIISSAYSRIIEHFPYGGGGYVVASKLLGPRFGVVSGSALLVDYILTISVSIASGADQVFSVLPSWLHEFKLATTILVIVLLTVLNLRGIKESVTALMPIFLLFLLCHAILIFGGLITHAFEAGRVVHEVSSGYSNGLATLGFAGMLAIFVRAYSMGAGTYTGIEAVSNGLSIMREPKVLTGKKTMFLMASSLAITAGGILICYLLFHANARPGMTMNAVLLENFAGSWQLAGLPVGRWFMVITLASEAALLFVAAQAGFIDGPRVMANMAHDSWLPHRFSSLSERLTMQNGVVLMSLASIAVLYYTHGDTSTLVLMYSINVFLTFSLSMLGMVRFWIQNRKKHPNWMRAILVQIIGLALCISIFAVNVIEKFFIGGWLTLLVTSILILTCFAIRRHYDKVRKHLAQLDEMLDNIPMGGDVQPKQLDRRAPTAVILVGGYGGLGLHTVLGIIKLFPQHFKNYIFLSVGVIDSANLKGAEEVEELRKETEHSLGRYRDMLSRLGYASEFRFAIGTEVVAEAEKLCREVAREFPNVIFFASKLVFQRERWYHKFFHNQTPYAIQRRLQFDGYTVMILPVRVFSENTRRSFSLSSLSRERT